MNWYNPYVTVPFIVWAIAQLTKFVVAAIRQKPDVRYLYASGGMPSAHAAVVCSLAVTAWLHAGLASAIFGISIIFAAIVMYDSFGVRRAAGEQARAINSILDALERQRSIDSQKRLREILGHKPLEVTAGALLGVILGLALNGSHITNQLEWLRSFPTHTEALVYIGISLVILFGGLVVSFWLSRRHKGSKAVRGLRRQLIVKDLAVGLTGLLLALAGYEQALYLGWRLWVYLLLVVFLVWTGVIASLNWDRLPKDLALEKEQDRINKWLPGKKHRRKG